MSKAFPYLNQGAAIAHDAPDDRLALIDLGTGTERRFTYGDLRRLSGAWAAALGARNLPPGTRVAILGANRAEYLIAFLGTMQAGLVAVPVNHKLPAETVGYIVADCDAGLAVGDAERLALAPATLPRIDFDSPEMATALATTPRPPTTPAPNDPAMFLYTSGSTGRPKGVVLSHRSHLWVMEIRARPVGPVGQKALVAAPLYHMNGLAMCQSVFAQGDTIVLLSSFTVRGYIEAAARYRVDFLTSVPTMIAMMLREPALLTANDLTRVRNVRMGSAPLTQGLIDQVRRAFPKAGISNGYGTTEAGPIAFGPHPAGKPQPELSVGAAHPAVRLRLMRGDREVDDEGALEMSCPAQMNGYHKLPEVTARALTPDGYYRTGDVFRRDADGFYFFVGRVDDMFVCGGENIYPGEVEKMLERHPAVQQAAVIPLPDELKGHKPIAYVVPVPGTTPTESDIKAFALANAPAYQHPRRVLFLDELPLAGTNKIDKKALAQRATADGISVT